MIRHDHLLPAGIRPFGLSTLFKEVEEGFCHAPLEENNSAYRFTAYAGVERIPSIIHAFGRLLPHEAFLILEHYTVDVSTIDWSKEDATQPNIAYSPYLPTVELLHILDSYLPRLIHDGFVGFGLANSREGLELFYSEEKVLTFFTGNHLQISNLLTQQGLSFRPEMKLPTDIEHEHLSLLNISRSKLPEALTDLSLKELDYRHFCNELIERLDMYQVSDGPSFFLTKKEQDQIEQVVKQQTSFTEFHDEEFGNLLLDWIDFVEECRNGFEGDLWEYRQALRLRDVIQTVAAHVNTPLSVKLMEIVQQADEDFQALLTDGHKRLDSGGDGQNPFWHQGMIRNPGSILRRDLIRSGWYKH